jgi:hypothetical protein
MISGWRTVRVEVTAPSRASPWTARRPVTTPATGPSKGIWGPWATLESVPPQAVLFLEVPAQQLLSHLVPRHGQERFPLVIRQGVTREELLELLFGDFGWLEGVRHPTPHLTTSPRLQVVEISS